MRAFLSLSLALLSLAVSSCIICGPEENPEPPCMSGIVVGETCMDGVLIQVDSAFAIGQPSPGLGRNVIAAVNVDELSSLRTIGQRVFFTYRADPDVPFCPRACPTNTIPLAVPHLVLGNLSTSGCGSSAPR